MFKVRVLTFRIDRPVTEENRDVFLSDFNRALFPKFWHLFSLWKIHIYWFLHTYVTAVHLDEPGTYRIAVQYKKRKVHVNLERKLE